MSESAPFMNGFNAAYAGTSPWDIGHPQGEFVRLAQAAKIQVGH
jgi:hypothetical protein